MLASSEHEIVQVDILKYAEAVGWIFVSHEEANRRQGFAPDVQSKNPAIYPAKMARMANFRKSGQRPGHRVRIAKPR